MERSMGDYNKTINEVILHVGLHKTGTSSIQATLYSQANNILMEKKDYLYPASLDPNHSIPIYSAFCDFPEKYHINVLLGYDIEQIKKINTQNLKALEMEISKIRKSKLVIVGEDISSLSMVNLHLLKKYFESLSSNDVTFKVIIYVRNPLTWSISSIQEKIKGGYTYHDAFNELKTIVKDLFTSSISKFIEVFGKDKVKVYPFEEAIQSSYSINGHFLSLLGFKESEIKQFRMARANVSISKISAELISFINEKLPLSQNNKLNEKRSNGDIIPLLTIRGPKFDIPHADKGEILEISKDDRKWLKEIWGIDYLNSKELAVSDGNKEFSEETCLDIKKAYFSPLLSLDLKDLLFNFLKEEQHQNVLDTNCFLKSLLDEITEVRN
ncbi:hypothetical protein QFZ28_004009 [Neobacillus niacini]|uniref:hypothetical protein n=1 Tax=Neobacillus niacini TaxID=86668 RepID=UPI00277EBC15|nr:hypothetical protein [Neobacillus niacini]MDQ1003609.1 hypothetical protein [Neobacillus niacini]